MKSPITGKAMRLIREPAVLTYRKDQFNVAYHVYECEDTGERFTNDELDAINMTQAHNQYRERYGIPFPQEISRIREKYKVSASKMSDILGLGANSYRLFENGDMPSVAIGRLILAADDPDEFIRQVKASAHILPPGDQERFINKAAEIRKAEQANLWGFMFEDKIFNNQVPNVYSGFRKPDLSRIAQVIAFFGGQMDLFKTMLNKLLFYSDFYAYKVSGYSITGITYRAIPYGPVPAEYDKLYIKLCDDEQINLLTIPIGNNNFGEKIEARVAFDQSLFTIQEMEALNKVAATFKRKTTRQVVDISHEEQAWIDNEPVRNNISYQDYAFRLKAI